MIVSMNAGFGVALPPIEVARMVAMGLTGCRTELHPNMLDADIEAILQPFVGSGLALLVLLHGESMSTPHLIAQAVRTVRIAHQLGLLIDLEPANEPVDSVAPEQMTDMLLELHEYLPEFGGTIYGGSVHNLHRKGLEYLKAMQWGRLPWAIGCAVHRYAPMNNPARSHLASFQHEIQAVIDATGRIPAVTEIGYHTALSTAEMQWWPLKYWPALQLTDEQAADALVRDLGLLRGWGCPRADVFQWNCATPANQYDYEALYGVRDEDGKPNARGRALLEFCTTGI